MMTNRSKGILSGALSGVSWGLNAVLIAMAMGLAPFVEHPILLVSGTFVCCMLHDLVAAISLSGYMAVRGKLGVVWQALSTRDAMFCMLAAVFGGPVAMSCYMLAIEHAGAALAATTTACYPLLGSALAVLLLREKMSPRAWIGLAICGLGVAYLGGGATGEIEGDGVFVGILFALGAAWGWASESVISAWGMKGDQITPEVALCIREWTSALTYILVVCPIFVGGYDSMCQAIEAVASHTETLSLVACAAMIGVFSFLMWYTSIHKIGASPALCLNVTYSFWSILFSVVLAGAPFALETAIGAVLVVSGVIYSVMNNRS